MYDRSQRDNLIAYDDAGNSLGSMLIGTNSGAHRARAFGISGDLFRAMTVKVVNDFPDPLDSYVLHFKNLP